MRIIDAEPCHIPAILDIRREVRADTYANDAMGATREYLLDRNTVTEDLIQEEFREIEAGEARCWVVEGGGHQPVAYLKIYDEPRQFIDIIHVLPSHQRKGLGPKLLAKALSCFDPGRPIYLEVMHDNDFAREWYERHGWQLTGKVLNGTPLPDGGCLQASEMVLLPDRRPDEMRMVYA